MGALDIAVVAVGSASGFVAFITAASTFLQDRLKSRKFNDDADNLEAATVTITDKEGNVILTLQSDDDDDRVQEVIKEIAAIRGAEKNQTEDARATDTRHDTFTNAPLPNVHSNVAYLTIYEAAIIMRVSKMTVYKMVRSGELDAIRTGRSYRIPEQAVNNYLKRVGAFNRPRLS